MGITVQPYEGAHQSGVTSLILSIQREEFGIPITLKQQPDLLDIPRFYQKGSGNFWSALSGGEVVGTVALLNIGSRHAALRKMFVTPAHRGEQSGVAASLLAEAFAWADKSGLSEIFLGTTAQFLAAHRFYRKYGFMEIEREQLPAAFPVMEVDTKFFRRPVVSGA